MKNATTKLAALAALAVCSACAEEAASGKDQFLKRQAFAEVQRITSQLDVLQNNYDDISSRVSRIEGGKGETASPRAEIDSVKADIAALRREMAAMRREIVNEIAGKIADVQKAEAKERKKAAESQKQPRSGKYKEYTVKSGDSLYLIAQAFGSTISKIKEANSLKNDNLKIGQKLMIPQD